MHYPHRLLLFVFGMPSAYLVYGLFSVEKPPHLWLIIPFGVVLATILVFRHQIDDWWIARQKPEPDPTLKKILRSKIFKYDRIFNGIAYTPSDHIIYTRHCSFTGQGLENIPDDLQHIISAHAFYFGNTDHKDWPGHFNRIVLYKHPFLTPKIDTDVHAVEHHIDDGVLIFSLEQGIPGLEQPLRFYNIFLHGFAEAFFDLFPVQMELDNNEIWDRLSRVFSISRQPIEQYTGLKDLSVEAVLAHYYIYRPAEVKALFPELAPFFNLINIEDMHINE